MVGIIGGAFGPNAGGAARIPEDNKLLTNPKIK